MRLKVEGSPVEVDGHTIPVTISVGISIAHDGVNGIAAMMKEADVALYEAKRTGRNRACAFDPAKAAAA
jgi:diguanylate cyclase (GGDEF)-like protein